MDRQVNDGLMKIYIVKLLGVPNKLTMAVDQAIKNNYEFDHVTSNKNVTENEVTLNLGFYCLFILACNNV